MKILLTGATGYIGKRLLPVLLEEGHNVVCCTRDTARFNVPKGAENLVEVVEVDFLKPETLINIPTDIEFAYYLVHSMSTSTTDFDTLEKKSAEAFKNYMNKTDVQQVIYLSGMANDERLSKHLASRHDVEKILGSGNFSLTTLRAGIIVGSGSSSFEIMRDLVEKLPVMVAPKWLKTKCQPIGIYDVIQFLIKALNHTETFHRSFDIGGSDILTYKEMLLRFAKMRGLKRLIISVPVMTPRLSSYWLYFVTSTSFKLARSLVDSMRVEVVCQNDDINHILNVEPEGYEKSLERAFARVSQNTIVSSWKDSKVSGRIRKQLSDYVEVPTYGCYTDKRKRKVKDEKEVLDRIWSIGGKTGWYYATWMWKFRGFLDKLFGGVGLRRGRTHPHKIVAGDALDFWRVIYADRKEKRMLLYAEMKVPGEAWLEFRIEDGNLHQTATFRPKGVWGRFYWLIVMPMHEIVFRGLVNKLVG